MHETIKAKNIHVNPQMGILAVVIECPIAQVDVLLYACVNSSAPKNIELVGAKRSIYGSVERCSCGSRHRIKVEPGTPIVHPFDPNSKVVDVTVEKYHGINAVAHIVT